MIRDAPPAVQLQLVDVVETCPGAPSRWSAKTLDDRPVDIRYRGGGLTVRVGALGASPEEVRTVEPVVDLMITAAADSCASWDEVAEWANLKLVG